jgi:uncharacterized membrane protein
MILLYAIAILVVTVSNFINNIWLSLLMVLVLVGFISMGLVTMIVKISKGEEASLDDLFSKVHLFFKTFVLTVVIGVIVGVFVTFLGVALYGLYTSCGLWGICSGWVVTLLICIGIILSMALLVFTMYVSLSFTQVYFIFYDNPEMSIMNILKQSYNMMDGHKLELFVLLFSFIGWIIIGIFTLGILYLWLIPYIFVTLAQYYEALKPKKTKRGRPKKKKVE